MQTFKIMTFSGADHAGAALNGFALFLVDGEKKQIVPMEFNGEHVAEPLFASREAIVEALTDAGMIVNDDDTVNIGPEGIELVPPPENGMTIQEALGIVLELAEENVTDDPEMVDETARQLAAIEMVKQLTKLRIN